MSSKDVNNSYSLGLYEKAMPKELTWSEKLKATKEAGYDFLEISIDETAEKLNRLDYSREQLFAMVEEMNRQQVYIRTMCLSGHRKYPLGSHDEMIRMQSLRIMKKAIAFADVLGIRIIQLAGYDVYYEDSDEETKALFLENLRLCVAMAAKKGIVLGFETMETSFMNTIEKAMQYISAINSPYLQVYPDIGNLTNAALESKSNVLDDIRLGEGHLVAAHLKETIPNVFREVPYGTGHTDFVGCVRELYQVGVRLYTAEFWYVGSERWREELKEANSFLRVRIEEAIQ